MDLATLVESRRGLGKVAIFPSRDLSELNCGTMSSAHVDAQRTRPMRDFDDI